MRGGPLSCCGTPHPRLEAQEICMPVSPDPSFSSYIPLQRTSFGKEFLGTAPFWDCVVCGSQETSPCVTINLDDRMLRKDPDYNGQL